MLLSTAGSTSQATSYICLCVYFLFIFCDLNGCRGKVVLWFVLRKRKWARRRSWPSPWVSVGICSDVVILWKVISVISNFLFMVRCISHLPQCLFKIICKGWRRKGQSTHWFLRGAHVPPLAPLTTLSTIHSLTLCYVLIFLCLSFLFFWTFMPCFCSLYSISPSSVCLHLSLRHFWQFVFVIT